jgi:hypothetical protein
MFCFCSRYNGNACAAAGLSFSPCSEAGGIQVVHYRVKHRGETARRATACGDKRKSASAGDADNAERTVTVTAKPGDDPDLAAAKVMTGPHITNAFALAQFGQPTLGKLALDHVAKALLAKAEAVNAGDMREAEALLISQAATLNIMFGQLAHRAAINLDEYPMAAD